MKCAAEDVNGRKEKGNLSSSIDRTDAIRFAAKLPAGHLLRNNSGLRCDATPVSYTSVSGKHDPTPSHLPRPTAPRNPLCFHQHFPGMSFFFLFYFRSSRPLFSSCKKVGRSSGHRKRVSARIRDAKVLKPQKKIRFAATEICGKSVTRGYKFLLHLSGRKMGVPQTNARQNWIQLLMMILE